MPDPLVAVLIGRHPKERYSVHTGYVDALHAVGGVIDQAVQATTPASAPK